MYEKFYLHFSRNTRPFVRARTKMRVVTLILSLYDSFFKRIALSFSRFIRLNARFDRLNKKFLVFTCKNGDFSYFFLLIHKFI